MVLLLTASDAFRGPEREGRAIPAERGAEQGRGVGVAFGVQAAIGDGRSRVGDAEHMVSTAERLTLMIVPGELIV